MTRVRINGRILSLRKACELLQISPTTVYSRIESGASVIEALSLPVTSDDPTIRNRLVESSSIEIYIPKEKEEGAIEVHSLWR
jgi:hypothetical protein